jgi:hypothetical protein
MLLNVWRPFIIHSSKHWFSSGICGFGLLSYLVREFAEVGVYLFIVCSFR